MITLYELHWSHYCEKIRLALDYMQLPWQMVGIHPFSKKEMRTHPLPAHLHSYTVPAILDDSTGAFVMDSTPILRYLANTYPDAPALFPGDVANRAAIDAQLIEFDTMLSLPARRFGYSQLIFERPDVLADLFMTPAWRVPIVRSVVGRVLGMVLCKRFDFHLSESTGLYEALEAYLLQLSAKLEDQAYVVGTQFSVADLALAAQFRPLTIVPFFAENPQLQSLFARQRSVLAAHSREGDAVYQSAIADARRSKAPVRRTLRDAQHQRTANMPFKVQTEDADNDQRHVWDSSMWAMPWHFYVTLRQGKLRQQHASSTAR